MPMIREDYVTRSLVENYRGNLTAEMNRLCDQYQRDIAHAQMRDVLRPEIFDSPIMRTNMGKSAGMPPNLESRVSTDVRKRLVIDTVVMMRNTPDYAINNIGSVHSVAPTLTFQELAQIEMLNRIIDGKWSEHVSPDVSGMIMEIMGSLNVKPQYE